MTGSILLALKFALASSAPVNLPDLIREAYDHRTAARELEDEIASVATDDPLQAAELRTRAIRHWAAMADGMMAASRLIDSRGPHGRDQQVTRVLEAVDALTAAEQLRSANLGPQPGCKIHLRKARDEYVLPTLAALGQDPSGIDLQSALATLERNIGDTCAGPVKPAPVPPETWLLTRKSRLAGLGTSAGLSVVLAITAGIAFQRIRTGGPLNHKIVEQGMGAPGYDPFAADLCDLPALTIPEVQSLCRRHQNLRALAIVSGSLLGVSLASTVVFAVMAGCAEREGGCRRRRARVQPDIAYLTGGVSLSLRGRF